MHLDDEIAPVASLFRRRLWLYGVAGAEARAPAIQQSPPAALTAGGRTESLTRRRVGPSAAGGIAGGARPAARTLRSAAAGSAATALAAAARGLAAAASATAAIRSLTHCRFLSDGPESGMIALIRTGPNRASATENGAITRLRRVRRHPPVNRLGACIRVRARPRTMPERQERSGTVLRLALRSGSPPRAPGDLRWCRSRRRGRHPS